MSSSGEIRIDPAVLSDAAQVISGSAQQIAGQVNALQATVTTGNPWGSDGPGTAFGMAYTMVLGTALETFGSHVELLGSAGADLVAWAQTMTTADDVSVESFGYIADAL